jgi:hypothetical protein
VQQLFAGEEWTGRGLHRAFATWFELCELGGGAKQRVVLLYVSYWSLAG